MPHDFWERWENKVGIEKKAIRVVKKARDLVISSIPRCALVAIYIKGSFVRREMKKGSDVDMVPIVTENSYEGKVFGVNSLQINPVIVVPLSLWELRHNKLFTKGNYVPDLRAEPDLFLRNLSQHKLIFGRSLNPRNFPMRKDKEVLRDEIKKIQEGYIPAYQKGVIDFSPLLKEVFWLVELEQKLRGNKISHSFNGIAKSVRDKDHIIHDAFRLRSHPTRDKKTILGFIKKLKFYLKKLEKIKHAR